MDGRMSPANDAGVSRTRNSRSSRPYDTTPRTVRSQTPQRLGHSRSRSHSYSQNPPQQPPIQQQRDTRSTRTHGMPLLPPSPAPEQNRGRLTRSRRDRDDRSRPSNVPRSTSVPPQSASTSAQPIASPAVRERKTSQTRDNNHPPPARSQAQTNGYSSDPQYRRERRDSSTSRDKDFFNDPVRAHLRQVANSTLDILSKGYLDIPLTPTQPQQQPMVLRYTIIRYLEQTKKDTLLYSEQADELVNWKKKPKVIKGATKKSLGGMKVEIAPMTTLQGARYIAENLPGVSSKPNTPHTSLSMNVTSPTTSTSGVTPTQRIGVLNFASATKPGGGFLNGARAQEESIARSSSLSLSLTTPSARPFYDVHRKLERDADRPSGGKDDFRGQIKGMYTHIMVYSPSVVIFKDDEGNLLKPLSVEVVTSPAVNAGEVRKAFNARAAANPRAPGPSQQEIESLILSVMHERMGRILALFEAHSIRHLVLGSFGTGVFQNDVQSIASIWKDLLMGSQARFRDSFDTVVFAIPDSATVAKFGKGLK